MVLTSIVEHGGPEKAHAQTPIDPTPKTLQLSPSTPIVPNCSLFHVRLQQVFIPAKSPGPQRQPALNWVAVKELKFSYHNGYYIYIHRVNHGCKQATQSSCARQTSLGPGPTNRALSRFTKAWRFRVLGLARMDCIDSLYVFSVFMCCSVLFFLYPLSVFSV